MDNLLAVLPAATQTTPLAQHGRGARPVQATTSRPRLGTIWPNKSPQKPTREATGGPALEDALLAGLTPVTQTTPTRAQPTACSRWRSLITARGAGQTAAASLWRIAARPKRPPPVVICAPPTGVGCCHPGSGWLACWLPRRPAPGRAPGRPRDERIERQPAIFAARVLERSAAHEPPPLEVSGQRRLSSQMKWQSTSLKRPPRVDIRGLLALMAATEADGAAKSHARERADDLPLHATLLR